MGSKNILRISSRAELEKYMFYYNCQTREELEELLLTEYNTIVKYSKNKKHETGF